MFNIKIDYKEDIYNQYSKWKAQQIGGYQQQFVSYYNMEFQSLGLIEEQR